MCGSMDKASVFGTEGPWFDAAPVEPHYDSKIEASVVCDRTQVFF